MEWINQAFPAGAAPSGPHLRACPSPISSPLPARGVWRITQNLDAAPFLKASLPAHGTAFLKYRFVSGFSQKIRSGMHAGQKHALVSPRQMMMKS